MAFSHSASDRMDEFRFRSQQSPRNESPLPLSGLTSPIRNGRLPPPLSTHDTGGRVSLTRRFTTDSGRVPTINSIGSQRGIQAPESVDFPPPNYHAVQILEKKRMQYEQLKEQKRRFEAEMQLLKQDLDRAPSNNTNQNHNGHQSEPSTPPEYRETSSGFPSVFSRPNRYSTSSITSPPGLYNRPGRSGSQLTSPQSGIIPSRHMMDEVFSPQSVPGSRGGSDDDDKQEAVRQDPTSYRSSNTSNRYSMPVTKSRNPIQDLIDHDLDQTNTAEFLFGDEEPRSAVDNYLEKGSTKDNFPILLNRNGMSLSASHLALDLAIEPSASPEPQSFLFGGPYTRHRSSHSTSTNGLMSLQDILSPGATSKPTGQFPVTTNPQNGRNTYRTSIDMSYVDEGKDALAAMTSPKHISTPPKLQSSYSTNDVPTMKNGSGDARNYSLANMTSPNSHAQQYLHQHNASTGRFPTNGVNNRHSRELSSGEVAGLRESQGNGLPSIQSALHASAPSFSIPQPRSQQHQSTQGMSLAQNYPQYGNQYTPQAFDYLQNVQQLTGAMQNMQMTTIPDMRMAQNGYAPPQAYNNSQMYGNYNMYSPSVAMQQHGNQHNGYTRGHDSQARVIESRRKQDGEKMAQFKGQTVDSLRGQIYINCKDQYGCRFLQQVIERNDPDDVYAIWSETCEHVVELMMDPFGNYLCQKLFELCQNPERTMLIQNAAQGNNMFSIAVSPHGTRALQKMIEHAYTPEQIGIIIEALKSNVVELIQSLNGNHVIQKCLTKFAPQDSQFIFDAVAAQCIDVGTHRHGCCVLQRCIDHAKDEQKANLIRAITNYSRQLVADAYGNYVIQYILDLNEDKYTEAIVLTFQGKVEELSRHKFSSNVIEKCIRTASVPSKKMIMDELTQPIVLRNCAGDNYANYVIQTALDHTQGEMRQRLVENLRPVLPQIRNQPCGKRIQAKMEGENRKGDKSGLNTPNDGGQIPLPRLQQHTRGNSNNSNTYVYGALPNIPNGANGANGANGTNGYDRPNGFRPNRQAMFIAGSRQHNGNNGHGRGHSEQPDRGGFGGTATEGSFF